MCNLAGSRLLALGLPMADGVRTMIRLLAHNTRLAIAAALSHHLQKRRRAGGRKERNERCRAVRELLEARGLKP